MSRLEIYTLYDLLHVYGLVDEDHNELFGSRCDLLHINYMENKKSNGFHMI